ncbi:hypothetical protein MAR_007403 [Mya arenaria]|uniref:Uncharacterized protein n=1 Tax=Mya arenaria TaxID=6604 RepID=A0ABY7DBA5_MYAAR|nr:hypothetical protein MAR_007403 [Mya arenaria]
MLELLSITDAAAKAVNKSSHLATGHGFQRSLTQSGQSSCCEGSHVSWPMDPLTHTGHSQGSQRSQQDDRLTSQQLNDRSGKSVGSARSRGMSVRSRVSEVSVTSDVSVDSGVSKQPHISAVSGVSVHSARSALSLGNRQCGGKAVKDLRHDSGVISKTQTQSDSKVSGTTLAGSEFGEYSYDRSSDDGITVSGILIKSTHENNEHSVIENRAKQAEKNGHSSSTMSKCLNTSNRVEIFNSISYDCKRPSSLLKGKHSGRQMVSSDGQNSTDKDAVISVNDSDRKITVGVKMKFTRGTDSQYNNQFEVQKEKKSAEKGFGDVDIAKAEQRSDFERKSQFHNASLQNASSDYKYPSTYQLPTSGKGHVNVIESDVHFVSTTKPSVEQHTNRKCLPGKADLSGGQQIPALLHDPEDSIQIISAYAQDTSTGSCQPEIVTLPERTTMVSATNFVSPSSVTSEPVTKTTTLPMTFHSAGSRLLDDKGSSCEEKSLGSLDTSTGSCQPEIVTLPERPTMVSATNFVSPSSVTSEPVTKTTTLPMTFHSAGFRLLDDKGSSCEEKSLVLTDGKASMAVMRNLQKKYYNMKGTVTNISGKKREYMTNAWLAYSVGNYINTE